jgi:hypothetical protein
MKHIINSTIKKLDGLKVTIPDSPSGTAYNKSGYRSDNFDENNNTDTFSNVKIETPNGKKITKRMYQPNPLETIKNDIKKIEQGNIRGTELKNEFAKIMFAKDEKYNLNVNGTKVKGKYIAPNPINSKQSRFEVNGKIINTDKEDIKIEIDKKEFDI